MLASTLAAQMVRAQSHPRTLIANSAVAGDVPPAPQGSRVEMELLRDLAPSTTALRDIDRCRDRPPANGPLALPTVLSKCRPLSPPQASGSSWHGFAMSYLLVFR